MKSAAQAMLNKTAREVWSRGGAYADSGKVSVAKWDDRGIEATVTGTSSYQVLLRHSGSGFTRRCDCPYAGGSSGRVICKHLVAVALAWDALRGIPRPTATEVEQLTIPPPEISHRQINALFADPLRADLELLRIYAEAGKWSRPHSQLPKMPPIKVEASRPLSVREVTRVFETMRRWADRTTFDPYFCAGEMMAAFCAVLRVIRARIAATSVTAASEALIVAQQFHRALVLELIDDSDGLHEFGEAHLDDLLSAIKGLTVPSDQRPLVQQLSDRFEAGRHDY